jgi:hypothetical protein
MLAANAPEALNIIQQSSGATAEKWLRAKAALRAVIASIPKGTDVAIFAMSESTTALSGTAQNPYIDPYNNAELLSFLERLDRLDAGGGADLAKGLAAVNRLSQRASSLLLIGDGLPTAPAPSGSNLTEADRVQLFSRAQANRPNAPFNAILFPFEGDPSAAGLFWRLSGSTGGITLIPDNDWPTL